MPAQLEKGVPYGSDKFELGTRRARRRECNAFVSCSVVIGANMTMPAQLEKGVPYGSDKCFYRNQPLALWITRQFNAILPFVIVRYLLNNYSKVYKNAT